MRVSSSTVLSVGLVLLSADAVCAGSRFWEAKAPNPRSDSRPSYDTANATVGRALLHKRAMSINTDHDGSNRLWPKKKMRYCFDQDPAPVVLRGMWEQAQESWAVLREHGFTYEEVSRAKCDSDRASVLRIYYNEEGRLASTVGIPLVDAAWNSEHPNEQYEGPFCHLSDHEGVGNLDINANAAHELGHAWGLYHEHQNRNWWMTSDEHRMSLDPYWGLLPGTAQTAQFETAHFDCTALKDYETALAKVQQELADNPTSTDYARFCSSQAVAAHYGFSAAEWLPLVNMAGVNADSTFDPDSLMLYPSGAGGIGSGENRRAVLRYRNGDEIPVRTRPSSQDIQRLLALYGSESRRPGEPHNSSNFKSKLKKIRSKIFRAGDTRNGLC